MQHGEEKDIKNLSSVGYGITTSGLQPVELEPKEKNQGRIKFKKLKLKLKKIFEDIMADFLPNLMETINPQIQ